MKNINDLSNGLLCKIFRNLSICEHPVISEVSPRWNDIIERYVGRVLVVKSGNTFMVDPESTLDRMSIRSNYWMSLSSDYSLTANSTAGDKSLDKSSGDGKIVEEVEKLQDIPNPDSVQKIGFIGHLGLSGYTPLECILSPCKNITGLYLHMSLFCSTRKGTTKEDIWEASYSLPNLKDFVIDSSGVSHEDSKLLFSFKHAFIQIATFLCVQNFKMLEKFIVGLPYMESTEGIMTRALCIFLGRHAASLKTFSYTQKYEILEESEEETHDDEEGHQGSGDQEGTGSGVSFSAKTNYLSLSQLAVSMKELKLVNVEELFVNLVRRQESSPVWKNFLISQNSMRKCILAGDKIPFPEGTVEANAATLVWLRLDIRDSVNLRCLEKCSSLKHLSLGGRHDANESGSDIDQSCLSGLVYDPPVQLRNGKYLPPSLESLEIINLRTDKDEAKVLALDLSGLKDLILKNLGWEGNLGLKVAHLMGVFEKRQFNHFCIKSSVNMMSYQEMERECHHPIGNLFACVIQSNSFAAASKFFLEVWKTPSGRYTTVDDSDEEEEIDVFHVPDKVCLLEEEEEDSEDESSQATSKGGEEDTTSEKTGEATDHDEESLHCSEEEEGCEDDNGD